MVEGQTHLFNPVLSSATSPSVTLDEQGPESRQDPLCPSARSGMRQEDTTLSVRTTAEWVQPMRRARDTLTKALPGLPAPAQLTQAVKLHP